MSLEDRQVNVQRSRLAQGKAARRQSGPPRPLGAAEKPGHERADVRGVDAHGEERGNCKSAVTEWAIEASAVQLGELLERRSDATELLVICIDGMQFSAHHVTPVAAVGRQKKSLTLQEKSA